MPYLSGTIEPAGAVVDVLISAPQSRIALLNKHSFPPPKPILVRALLDTGSFLSGFHPRVFQALDLLAFDEIEILTPSTTSGTSFLVDRYWVNLALVAGQLQSKYLNMLLPVDRGQYDNLLALMVCAVAIGFLVPFAAILWLGRRVR